MLSSSSNVTRGRFKGIVEAYIASKKFPANAHPSFRGLATVAADSSQSPQDQTLSLDVKAQASAQIVSVTQPINFDSDEHEIALDVLYKDAEQAKNDFRAALCEYERKAPDHAKGHINIDALHTWDEIIAEVDTALNDHKHAKGVKGFMRKMRQSLGNNKDTALAWADFLPSSSEYFSILCGGLKLVIRAAARVSDITDELTSAMERFPEMLHFTYGTIEIFKSSKELQQCSANLYVALIGALLEMIRYLKKSSLSRLGGVLFKLEGYGRNIDESMELVKARSDQFRDCAQRCNYATNADSNRLTRLNLRETRQGFALISTEAQAQADRSIAEIQKMTPQISQQLKHMIQQAVNDILSHFLASDSRIDPRTHNLRNQPIGLCRSASDSSRLNDRSRKIRRQLMHTLHYEDHVATNDVRNNLCLPTDIRLQGPDRAQAIMRHHKMLQWISSPSSGALFVNGNHYQSFRQPPTSFVSARLTQAVNQVAARDRQGAAKRSNNIVLSFFCAEHRSQKDADSGPDGMMRSLIAQLLAAYPDFNTINISRMRDLDYNSVDDLCQVLDLLIPQLSEQHLVFCVVDNITTYEEQREWKHKAETAVKKLAGFAETTNDIGCTFKLLLTSPIQSRLLHRALPQNDVLWMPDRVPAIGNLTERAWADIISVNLPQPDLLPKAPRVNAVVEIVPGEEDDDSDNGAK